ncbi:ATP-dependent DNA helicase PIF1-like, partial [Octopus bimaculoides]|uniref:ATP-dependent DNA helicase PIF1-like n=1 Tax=Octopus bimaculoides TaxID=37653 RepID=UPI00071DE898
MARCLPMLQEKWKYSHFLLHVHSVDDLKDKVFPNLTENYQNHNWLCDRATLAPKNLNKQLMHSLPGSLHTYKSLDTIPDQNEVVNYPPEFLNSLEPPRLPPHILRLKLGSPVMLLRNLKLPQLSNETQLVVNKIMSHVIEAIILSGCGKGDDVSIPRILLTPSGAEIPLSFRRLQLPLRLSFVMSINKSQGQTLSVAGLFLKESCFLHRQLAKRMGEIHIVAIVAKNRLHLTESHEANWGHSD